MKRIAFVGLVAVIIAFLLQTSFAWKTGEIFIGKGQGDITPDSLRRLYEGPVSGWPAPWVESGVEWEELSALPARDEAFESSLSSPLVQLGKQLFFDPILSGSNQISCSSCHIPENSWADPLPLSFGHEQQVGIRNSPSLLNVKERKTLFWDGRVTFLEEQALEPIEAHHEMNMDLTKLIPKLKATPAYNQLFVAAFGDDRYSMPEVLSALAAFQRTLVSQPSRFDLFMNGQKAVLTTREIHGMHLFRTRARCMNCHYGPFLTDELFHHVGVASPGQAQADLGRYHVTGNPSDVGRFRTPSLRDVMNTGPWMHNGQFATMREILNLYNAGTLMNMGRLIHNGEDPLLPILDPLMKELRLSGNEIAAIEAFLHAITATPEAFERPAPLHR